MGSVYQRGDLNTAKIWYNKAAKVGDADAMRHAGNTLLNGRNEPAATESWYRRAADRGVVPAMDNLWNVLQRMGKMSRPMTGSAKPPRLKSQETNEPNATNNASNRLLASLTAPAEPAACSG